MTPQSADSSSEMMLGEICRFPVTSAMKVDATLEHASLQNFADEVCEIEVKMCSRGLPWPETIELPRVALMPGMSLTPRAL